jgi:hypothetical protein
MKRLFFLLFILFCFITCNKDTGTSPEDSEQQSNPNLTEEQQEYVDELDAVCHEVVSSSPDFLNSDLSSFDRYKDTRIVAFCFFCIVILILVPVVLSAFVFM